MVWRVEHQSQLALRDVELRGAKRKSEVWVSMRELTTRLHAEA